MEQFLRISVIILALTVLLGCGQAVAPTISSTGQARATAPRPQPPIAAPALSTALPAPGNLGALAYISQGNLWVKNLPDGAPRQLTTSGHATRPRWSPSGAWLAYCTDEQLWVVRAAGAEARAIGLCGGSWAPHADTLLHPLGDGLSLVTPGVWQEHAIPATGARWSADGATLLFVKETVLATSSGESGAPDRSVELWRAQADGSHAVKLFSAGTPAEYGMLLAGLEKDQALFWEDPVFSASLLADGAPLRAVPLRGGSPRELVPSMLAYPDFLASSPDGSKLAVTEGGGRESWSGKRIALVDLASGKLTRLTGDDETAISPIWSRDGQRLAYVAAPEARADTSDAEPPVLAQRRIWTMRPDGSDKRALTSDAAYRDELPLWSADSQSILFARLDRRNQASLWLMRADGSAPARLVGDLTLADESRYYGHISWEDSFDWWRG